MRPKSKDLRLLLSSLRRNAVSPGIGFGDYGDRRIRSALIENEERTRRALRGARAMLAQSILVG